MSTTSSTGEATAQSASPVPTSPQASGASRVLLAVFLSWWIPGAGHALLGRRSKALLYFALVTFTFVFGLWLSSFRGVSFENFALYLAAQSFYAVATALALLCTSHLELNAPMPFLDVGVLYTAVAGLLNLCVMVDVFETAYPRLSLDERAR